MHDYEDLYIRLDRDEAGFTLRLSSSTRGPDTAEDRFHFAHEGLPGRLDALEKSIYKLFEATAEEEKRNWSGHLDENSGGSRTSRSAEVSYRR
ncbi:MAG: hypothetical protein AAGF23_09025 [Acidobacteriota bacterium]